MQDPETDAHQNGKTQILDQGFVRWKNNQDLILSKSLMFCIFIYFCI
jgi:hypothetical protein